MPGVLLAIVATVGTGRNQCPTRFDVAIYRIRPNRTTLTAPYRCYRESTVDTSGYYHAHETARQDELDGVRLAGFTRRAIGFGIDFILVSILRKPALFLWQSYVPHEWERHTLLDLFQIVSAVVLVIYFSLALYIGNGQTIGKRLMGTRVISLTHSRITLWQAVERALGYGASFLEAGFGFLQYFINRNRQCVHDRIAQTIVADVRASATRAASPARTTG